MYEIIGIGTDITNIDRIRNILNRFGMKFVKKILTHKEINQYDNGNDIDLSDIFDAKSDNNVVKFNKITNYIARRFAAKEALSKALGLGIGKELKFHDFAILNNNSGAPYIEYLGLSGVIRKYHFYISISDDTSYAIAYVLVTC